MTIAITGASGQLGRLVTARLLETVPAEQLVLITRNPASLAEHTDRGGLVRRGDFADASSLPEAFAGVDKVLLVSTDAIGDRLETQRAAVAAAAHAGVRQIVYTSVPEPIEANPALVVPDHRFTEDAIRDAGVAWTFLRNNLYSELQLGGIAQARTSGTYVGNTGDGAAAYVTRGDCAAVAAGVLASDGHENRAYDVTGPQAVTGADLAALVGAEFVTVDDATYRDGLAGAGVPQPLVDVLVSFGCSIREGYLATVTDVVREVGGLEPTPIGALVQR